MDSNFFIQNHFILETKHIFNETQISQKKENVLSK